MIVIRHRRNSLNWILFFSGWLLIGVGEAPGQPFQPFEIRVVDSDNQWPVPMVELETTGKQLFVTDNADRAAFDLPELLNQKVWLSVRSHSYEFPKDGFGFRGVQITPRTGESITIRIKRKYPARRVGRLTGSGLYSESQQLGLESEWKDQGIVGCDTVRVARHQNKLFWVWGDTNLAGYPLGIFHTLGAVTATGPMEDFRPPLKFRFQYFRESRSGKPREIARMPGEGPTWLGGLVSIPDKSGKMFLVAHYTKIRKQLEVYESGLCIWDESSGNFKRHKVLWRKDDSQQKMPRLPDGHVTNWRDKKGNQWLLFGDPFPILKIPALLEEWEDPKTWVQLTPPSFLNRKGKKSVQVHRGSISWSFQRKKWIVIFGERNGTNSLLGEIWYAESDSPFGPWSQTQKVLSHNKYSFYNPRICSELMKKKDTFLLFEGTYTKTFSNTRVGTPKYDYNQILYRVDYKDLDFANPPTAN